MKLWKSLALFLCANMAISIAGCSYFQDNTTNKRQEEVQVSQKTITIQWKVKSFVDDVDINCIQLQRFFVNHESYMDAALVGKAKQVFDKYQGNYSAIDASTMREYLKADESAWDEIFQHEHLWSNDPQWKLIKNDHEIMRIRATRLAGVLDSL